MPGADTAGPQHCLSLPSSLPAHGRLDDRGEVPPGAAEEAVLPSSATALAAWSAQRGWRRRTRSRGATAGRPLPE
jgi:hypothetical protein